MPLVDIALFLSVQVVDCVRQCQRRLERILQTGAKRGLNKPTADDVDHARVLLCIVPLLVFLLGWDPSVISSQCVFMVYDNGFFGFVSCAEAQKVVLWRFKPSALPCTDKRQNNMKLLYACWLTAVTVTVQGLMVKLLTCDTSYWYSVTNNSLCVMFHLAHCETVPRVCLNCVLIMIRNQGTHGSGLFFSWEILTVSGKLRVGIKAS